MTDEQCSVCSLCKERTTIVHPRGSPNPNVLFIGEAPGREEDAQGKPFVGRSGKLLDEWMPKMGIKESDYAITNIVWCRPPNNRKPTLEEIQSCTKLHLLPYLKSVKPKLMIPLGKTATEFIFNNTFQRPHEFFITTMRRWVGTLISSDNISIIPLYHPSYILRTHISIDDLLSKVQKTISKIL